METKEQLFELYVSIKVSLKLFLYRLGLVHPGTYSREYIVKLYKQLKEACARQDFITHEVMDLGTELIDKGFFKSKQLLDNLKYYDLVFATYLIFFRITFDRDSLDELLTMCPHEEQFELWESHIDGIIEPEATLNAIISLIKHIKQITASNVEDFSKKERRKLKSEIRNIISFFPKHVLLREKREMRRELKSQSK